ncbi:MAG TPA: DUF3015 family protein [Candidatus Competibacter sp.]|nr:DUF3015 family protein [Candidatus Competibacter sp.]
MKRLLNAALIAALGFWVGACTIVTDPSSGSNATTGGSDKSGFLDRQQQIAEFASVNLDRLRNDMAAGQGEYLVSLATLLNVEPGHQPAFFALTRDQFAELFPDDRTTAAEMLAVLDRAMRADPRFGQRLTLN